MPDVRPVLLSQFSAALDMLGRAIDACPDAVWDDRGATSAFGDVVHHTLFYLDYDLAKSRDGFAPPAPFGLHELSGDIPYPPRVYTKQESRDYIAHCRTRLASRLSTITDAELQAPSAMSRPAMSTLEHLLHTLRHVQHHVGGLQSTLRRAGVEPPRWVALPRE